MSRRATCDDYLCLDLADPAILMALDLRRRTCGMLQWSFGDLDLAAVAFHWRPISKHLKITASIGGATISQTIMVTTTRPHFGGERLWFTCPQTGRRVRALFLLREERIWTSRAAARLPYASQRIGGARRRLQTLIARLHRHERRNALRRAKRARAC
ncbi:MAG: hypothetical protein AB7O98_14865 [Hyphomonadaceae bacterium]